MAKVRTGDEDESCPGDPLAEDPSELPVPVHGVEVGGGSSGEGSLGDTWDVLAGETHSAMKMSQS